MPQSPKKGNDVLIFALFSDPSSSIISSHPLPRFLRQPPIYHPRTPFSGHHEADKRHSDPEYGGISSGEKSALSRGILPETVAQDEEKMRGAEKYMEEKGKEMPEPKEHE